MPDDALGAAMWDFLRGEYDGTCVHRDPETGETWDANVESFYFSPPAEWADAERSFVGGLRTPLLDVGCGAGNVARVVQRRGRVVAFDASPLAVRTARARGVVAFVADMFRPPVGADRFETALVKGTQATLAGSDAELRGFLADLARVTSPTGEAWVDSYDPTRVEASHGHRPDEGAGESGVGRRRFRVEYRGRGLVGPVLEFRTVTPGHLRSVCEGTPWSVADVRRRGEFGYYRAKLEK